MNKKGLSQVVSVLILIVLILVAVGLIWLAVNKFIIQGTEGLDTDKFTINLEIRSATVDIEAGLATVKVARNSGRGNVTGIKFIVADSFSSEVYDFDVLNFGEFGERTFDLNLSQSDFLYVDDIQEISIAPFYITSSSPLVKLGPIMDSVKGNWSTRELPGNGEEGELPGPGECTIDEDCGPSVWDPNSDPMCTATNVLSQVKISYSCLVGNCVASTTWEQKELCSPGEYCNVELNECVENVECTSDEECPAYGPLGNPMCASGDFGPIIQLYANWSCNLDTSSCISATTTVELSACDAGWLCYDAACYEPQECVEGDVYGAWCDPGEICEEGTCVMEYAKNFGKVDSSWPNEHIYFESFDLPKISGAIKVGDYIIFPGSLETRCLNVASYTLVSGGNSYVQLSGAPTNVSANDNYEIWETQNACLTI